MATNGGTLHQGLPPTPRINLNCSQCGVLLDSVESLNVHNMHYHSEHIGRWGAPPGPNKSTSSTASNSPTDSENNNQPKQSIHNIQNSTKSESPLNNTISAAADSSDNQPSTTQPSSSVGSHEPRLAYGGYGMGITPSPFQHQQTDIHFQPYIHGYDQYYHHHTMEYGLPPAHYLNSQPPSQQEYKPVPSNRFHPYINNIVNVNSAHASSINSSVSPRNVSSSSPTPNSNVMQSTTSPLITASQPTPSPSPNQCDKCGHICETACQLSEHYATVHGSSGHNESNRPGSHEETEISAYPYSNYIKEEQPCDILDLDSHKMVYSPSDEPSQQGPLPSMHSLHPIQRQMWDHHTFLPHHQQDVKPVLFPANLPTKQEFSTTVIKPEYVHHQPQIGHQQQSDGKAFNNDVSANQVTTSPSEFPSTTTPQENGGQFRTSFEAATSSLPTSAPSGKSSSWKSNEARRPKTYNCTACNKWFTSSGHLKRHYNTTLHKNAVKSSGQPDPATVPISHHHHPARDQNKNSNNHRGSPGQLSGLSAPPPPEQSRSPEYSSQYLPPLGFQQTQGFQHWGTALAMHSTTVNSPNGQAGLSVLVSQQRGLLISLNNTGTQQVLPQQEQIFMQPIIQSHTINSPDPYNTINRTTINTNTTTASFQDIQQPDLLHPNFTTGNDENDEMSEMLSANCVDYTSMLEIVNERSLSSYNTSVPCAMHVRRLMGGVAAYQGDTASPYSPDMPDMNQTMCQLNPMSPPSAATQPPSPISIGSPSVTSTDNGANTNVMGARHECTLCNKVFNKACYLTQHNKTFHSGEKPFKCGKCGKRFPSDQSHEQHLAKHDGVKPYNCDYGVCGKSFNHKTDLRRHMFVHSGNKPHICDSCNKGFIRKDHMLKHMDTHRRKKAKKYGLSLTITD